MSDISFEYNVPVFAGAPDEGTEPTHRDTPAYEALDWETTKMGVQKAEELGFDAAWAPDHLLLGRDHAEYECWTLLSAIAGFTEDINLGSLVLCNDYRNPALVAKMAATLDVISDGRLELGLGAGWHEPEYDAYGWEYRDGFERLMRLDESIRLMKRMWAAGSDGASFDGKHYQIEDAYCVPGPVQD
uniref:LLM class flavin-dependent oxidoreductase n=1 Tax=Haloferax sp. KTX1 TaxID=2600597 RepID=UPI0011DCE762